MIADSTYPTFPLSPLRFIGWLLVILIMTPRSFVGKPFIGNQSGLRMALHFWQRLSYFYGSHRTSTGTLIRTAVCGIHPRTVEFYKIRDIPHNPSLPSRIVPQTKVTNRMASKGETVQRCPVSSASTLPNHRNSPGGHRVVPKEKPPASRAAGHIPRVGCWTGHRGSLGSRHRRTTRGCSH